jgi:rare lipoprotein A
MSKNLLILLITCISVYYTATAQPNPGAGPVKRKNHRIQYGIASFYANKFNGRHTANGEVFSQDKLTAASNSVAMNTWVRVTNLHNKKEVTVKVNDRMHFRNKRLIDLSHAAAKKLGYTGWGLARVRVEILGRKKFEDRWLSDK